MNKPKIVFSGFEHIYQNNIEKLIEVSNLYGIDNYELWFPHNAKFEALPQIESKLKNEGKKVVCVTTWSHLYSENVKNEQELVSRSLHVAKRLDAERVNTYFGCHTFRNSRRAIDVYAKNIARILKIAEKLDIKICLENEFDGHGEDPFFSDITRSADLIFDLLKKIDSPCFKLTFDPANSYVAGEEPYPYFYNLLKRYIDYIHLKDVRKYYYSLDQNQMFYSDHDRNYVFAPLGEGAINYLSIFKSLTKDNYQGYFALEPHINNEDFLMNAYDVSLKFINDCFCFLSKE